ncbi:thiol peroxidase [Clostridium mediterraneense]|uniref:thiol peroxidase n=1 Tax=Clostridium mediterraneense TaxID=1805472 RepID=UPI00082DF318|nr:thiol peroxidase [Clostridium mediterraneense]
MKTVFFNQNPVSLKGQEVIVGEEFRNFTAIDNALQEFNSKDTKGIRVFVAVPSLDTGVCDLEVRTFNERLAKVENVTCYTISMDLPFAQARWCGANDIDIVKTVSDFKDRNFGEVTGTYINELGLLTRAVFVVDSNNKVVYSEYVEEVTNQPNYDAVLEAVKSAK